MLHKLETPKHALNRIVNIEQNNSVSSICAVMLRPTHQRIELGLVRSRRGARRSFTCVYYEGIAERIEKPLRKRQRQRPLEVQGNFIKRKNKIEASSKTEWEDCADGKSMLNGS